MLRQSLASIPPWEFLVGGLLGISGIAVLLVGSSLGLARYFVLQLCGQLVASAVLQNTSEVLATGSIVFLQVVLQLLAILLSIGGAAFVLMDPDKSDHEKSRPSIAAAAVTNATGFDEVSGRSEEEEPVDEGEGPVVGGPYWCANDSVAKLGR